MIVDTSVLVALVKMEPEVDMLVRILAAAPRVQISAANYFEFAMVVDKLRVLPFSARVDQIIERFRIEVVPVTEDHARMARQAYRSYGKGNHAAGLNFGDCFSYALAKTLGEPLLFKGEDFALTDIEPALRP